jgi:hypothetical protein
MWKKTVVAYLQALFRYLYGENCGNLRQDLRLRAGTKTRDFIYTNKTSAV